MSDRPGRLEEVVWVPVGNIGKDAEYQRNLNLERVKVIADNFSWMAFGVLTVGYRDGNYWVVDGQHRLAAAKRAGERLVPCIILPPTTMPTEAGLFRAINKERGPLKAHDMFRAALASGDPAARAIVATANERGLSVSTILTTNRTTIAAVASLEWVYKRGGSELLGDVFDVLQLAMRDEREPWAGNLIQGMATFLHVYGREIDRKRLFRRLAETTLFQIRKRAAYLRELSDHNPFLPNLWARVLVELVYNPRLRSGKLDVTRLERVRWADTGSEERLQS